MPVMKWVCFRERRVSMKVRGHLFHMILGLALGVAGAGYALDLELVGTYGGAVHVITIDNHRAYVGAGLYLAVYDISGYGYPRPVGYTPPESPLRLGQFFMHGPVKAVAIYKNVAYVAADAGGLALVDANDPANMRIIRKVDLPGQAKDVQMGANCAYVSWGDSSEGTGGVEILDISNPENPATLASYVLPGIGAKQVLLGDTLYANWGTDNGGNFDVVDVSDPAHPVGTRPFEGDAGMSILAANTRSVMLRLLGSLIMTDPLFQTLEPSPCSFCDGSCSYQAIVLTDDILYMLSGKELGMVDISSPTYSVSLGCFHLTGYAETLTIDQGVAYAGRQGGSLELVSVVNPSSPSEITVSSECHVATDLVLDEGHAYVPWVSQLEATYYDVSGSAPKQAGFDIISTGDPGAPELLGGYATSSTHDNPSGYYDYYNYYALTAVASTVYGVYSTLDYSSGITGRLDVIDTSNPAAPTMLGSLPVSNFVMTMARKENTLYLGGYSNYYGDPNVQIVDISEPGNPNYPEDACTTLFSNDYYLRGIQLEARGDMLLCAMGNFYEYGDLFLADIQDPICPDLIASYPGDYSVYDADVLDLSLFGDRAYIVYKDSNYTSHLDIVDIAHPRTPERLGLYTPATWYNVQAVAGMYSSAFIGFQDGMVQALDVKDPAAPVVLDSYDAGTDVIAIKVKDGFVYVLSEYNGLQILDSHRYPLEISVEGQGTTTPAAGYHELDADPALTVTASPAAGWQFARWDGAPAGSEMANPLTLPFTHKYALTAVFSEIQYTLSIGKEGEGYTDPVPGTHVYVHDSSVSVTAVPEAGWEFDRWEGVPEEDAQANPVTVTMTGDRAITAVFTPVLFTLTISAGEGGSCSPAPGIHSYSQGQTVSAAAIPEDGWSFDHWEGDAGEGGTGESPCPFHGRGQVVDRRVYGAHLHPHHGGHGRGNTES